MLPVTWELLPKCQHNFIIISLLCFLVAYFFSIRNTHFKDLLCFEPKTLLKSSFFCTYFCWSKLLFAGFAVSQITLRLEQCLAYSSVLTFLYSLQIENFTPYMKKASASQTALDVFCRFFPSWLFGHSGETGGICKRNIVHSHWC
jgi:hypothetical protein